MNDNLRSRTDSLTVLTKSSIQIGSARTFRKQPWAVMKRQVQHYQFPQRKKRKMHVSESFNIFVDDVVVSDIKLRSNRSIGGFLRRWRAEFYRIYICKTLAAQLLEIWLITSIHDSTICEFGRSLKTNLKTYAFSKLCAYRSIKTVRRCAKML